MESEKIKQFFLEISPNDLKEQCKNWKMSYGDYRALKVFLVTSQQYEKAAYIRDVEVLFEKTFKENGQNKNDMGGLYTEDNYKEWSNILFENLEREGFLQEQKNDQS